MSETATRTYSTRDEAIQAEIIDPIMAGDVQDAYSEYDIDAIASLVLGGYSDGYASRVDDAEFWDIVERHAQ